MYAIKHTHNIRVAAPKTIATIDDLTKEAFEKAIGKLKCHRANVIYWQLDFANDAADAFTSRGEIYEIERIICKEWQPKTESKSMKKTQEYKIAVVREVYVSSDNATCPKEIETYWREAIETAPWYDCDKEHLVAIHVNTKRKITGYDLVSIGSLSETTAHPREIFRKAIMRSASVLIIVHNHPSGDPSPSDADIRLTRKIAKAGNLLSVELLDSIIIGHKSHQSLRELGYLYE